MSLPLTTEERFKRAEAALAESITEETPGRQRAALITKTRTQYNAGYRALGAILRQRIPGAKEAQTRARRILDDLEAQIRHARRFSQ